MPLAVMVVVMVVMLVGVIVVVLVGGGISAGGGSGCGKLWCRGSWCGCLAVCGQQHVSVVSL